MRCALPNISDIKIFRILEKLTTSNMISLVEWKTGNNELVTNSLQWFQLYIGEFDVEMLKKLLQVCKDFHDPSSFDEKYISLHFAQDEVFPRASVSTFALILP